MKQAFLSYFVIISAFASDSDAEFQVNTRTTYDQTDADIAMDAEGNFLVVWSSYRQDGHSGGVFGQRFDTGGNPVGEEFQVNTATQGNQTEPSVAVDAVGNFVIVWHGPQSVADSNEDIFARRFDANGQPLGDEFRVNTNTNSRQLCPSVAMNNDGNFVVVWESEDVPTEGLKAICGRIYNSSGTANGVEFVVSDQPPVCRYPDVVMYSSGKFIAVWVKDTTTKSVWRRHFEADGTAPYFSFEVNDGLNFSSLTHPAIAMDSLGNYVIAWDGHPVTYLEDDVYLKRFHWSGAPHHQQFAVNSYKSGAQSNPDVAMSGEGDFVVVWQSDTGSENANKDIFGQRFPSQGEHIGDPILMGDQFRINTYVAEDQRYPAAAMSNTGRFVTVWESYSQDGSGYGIFAEFGPKICCADFSGDGFVNLRDYCVLTQEWLKDENPLEADLVDDNRIDEQDLGALCEQWLTPCHQCSEADINSDGKINFKDYALWAANWSNQGPNLDGDITANGIVDMADLKAIAFHWLKTCE